MATTNSIKLQMVVEDKVSGTVTTMTKTVTTSMAKVEKSTSKTNKTLNSMLKGFLALEVGKKIFRGLADSVKAFEQASGGKILSNLNQSFEQLKVEIGSVLMPELEKFAGWWKDNEEKILTVVRAITKGITFAFKSIVLVIRSFGLEFGIVLTNIFKFMVDKVRDFTGMLSGLPIFPASWRKGLSDFSNAANEQSKILKGVVSKNAEELTKIGADFISNWNDLAKFDPSKGSGVKAKTKEQLDAEKIQRDLARQNAQELLGIDKEFYKLREEMDEQYYKVYYYNTLSEGDKELADLDDK